MAKVDAYIYLDVSSKQYQCLANLLIVREDSYMIVI